MQGKVYGRATAREMQELKPKLMPYVLESFAKLKQEADIVLVEGAGSASEINLRKNDIANMGFARAADVPVVVIGDIDRGGVIASLVGTKAVLDPEDAKLVAGFIVNRMRGDVSLFAEGMEEIARRTGWPALGLVPFFEGARRLPAEDAYDLVERRATRSNGKVRVAVPLLPHIANFDDLDPLAAEPDVDVVMVKQGHPLPVCDLIVLAGVEGDHRRPWRAPRARLGHRHRRACAARRPCAWAVRRLSDAGADASQIRTASRARRVQCRASACCRSTR